MFFAIKIILIILMPVGLVFSLYGSLEMWQTKSLLSISTGKAKARFYDYYREYEETTSITSMPDGSLRSDRGMSVASYPEFIYQAGDGTMKSVRESKVHVIEIFKPGEEIEIVLFDNYPPRIAGFYSLYMHDLVILIIGLGFILIPALFLKFALPRFTSPERSEVAKTFELFVNQSINNALNEKIGPFSVKSILVGFALFIGATIIIALIAGVIPYLEQMRFGAGGRLLEAFEDRQFNKAREMIAKGSGINATDEFNQSPLLLALKAGQIDLARMLINAGADVNVKSKMLMRWQRFCCPRELLQTHLLTKRLHFPMR